MNGYNRRRKYRRSAYRRRHIGTVLITVAISVVSFLIILLIVGNILHKKIYFVNHSFQLSQYFHHYPAFFFFSFIKNRLL